MPIAKMKSILSPQMWATVLLILSGVLYGSLGYFGTKILNDHFSVPNMLFWRFFTAFLWMLVFLFWKREKKSVTTFTKRSLLSAFVIGSLFYSASTTFYFLASQYTGTGLAMVIFFSYPVFVALYAWLTKKTQINKIAVFSLLTISIGMILLKGQGESALNVTGIIFSIASALFYACYVMSSKKSAGVMSSELLTIVICLGNSIIFFVIANATHTFVIPHSFDTWLHIFALGIFATALPIQLLFEGLKYVSSLKASILSVLEPVITMLVGAALLNESISSLQLIGVCIVLLGATLIQFERQQ